MKTTESLLTGTLTVFHGYILLLILCSASWVTVTGDLRNNLRNASSELWRRIEDSFLVE